ncbi:hypothetical protein F4804DRAFT_183998 [Jackrogersella minutella]|nr:hypothetical protein F4804DRAFT_183998 [Jackrogersella minutella]
METGVTGTGKGWPCISSFFLFTSLGLEPVASFSVRPAGLYGVGIFHLPTTLTNQVWPPLTIPIRFLQFLYLSRFSSFHDVYLRQGHEGGRTVSTPPDQVGSQLEALACTWTEEGCPQINLLGL